MKKSALVFTCLFFLICAGLSCENNREGNRTCQALQDRIDIHRQMAEAYYSAYDQQAVQDGAAYEGWKFADDAVYWSPYFTQGEIIELHATAEETAGSIANSATMEAKAFSVNFPDWGPVEFKSWPSDHGFVMRTLFEGHHKDTGEKMSFYTHGFVETNSEGEITRWETWPDDQFDPFLKIAIGASGPWHTPTEYFEAIIRYLQSNDLM